MHGLDFRGFAIWVRGAAGILLLAFIQLSYSTGWVVFKLAGYFSEIFLNPNLFQFLSAWRRPFCSFSYLLSLFVYVCSITQSKSNLNSKPLLEGNQPQEVAQKVHKKVVVP